VARISPCPNCEGSNLYQTDDVSSGGGYAPNYLPRLGGMFSRAKFRIVVCRDCGLTRFFAQKEAVSRLDGAKWWTRAR